MRLLLLLSLPLLTTVACSSDEAEFTTPDELRGQWVEILGRADTISFVRIPDSEWDWLGLGRGRELRNGNDLPRPNSGPYEYKVTDDVISLRWIASSNSAFNDYPFEYRGDEIRMGNFYDDALGELLTFERL